MAVEWGSVAEWVSGIGTAGAFLIAAGAWRTQVRERHESAAEKREQANRDRVAHANRLTLWAEGLATSQTDDGRWRFGTYVFALNGSDHPFTNLTVKLTGAGPGWKQSVDVQWPRLLPSKSGEAERREAGLIVDEAGPILPDRAPTRPRWAVEAWFTDAHGVRWHSVDGVLETVRADHAVTSSSTIS